MAGSPLTYALLANPKLIETGYSVARGTALTAGKLLFYGAVGYGTYKALSQLIDKVGAKQQVRQNIQNVQDTAYKAALYFTTYFQASTIDRAKVKELVKQVYAHNDFSRAAQYYFNLNFGKTWKSDCVALGMFCKHFDSSGDLFSHLKVALDDEFREIIPYLGRSGSR